MRRPMCLLGLALLLGCGEDEGAADCREPFDFRCCSEAGIPLEPVCEEGELVCPEGTQDCAALA